MIRRPVYILFLLAMLILPQTSGALPREVCNPSDASDCVGFESTGTGFTSIETLTVPSDGAFRFTTSLTRGFQYRLKVTGTWRYDSNPNHMADTAYSTSDGWGSASKTPGGRSLEIEGLKQSDTPVSYSSAHVYALDRVAEVNGPLRLRIFDNSYTDGNLGSLTVEVLRAQRVVYSGNVDLLFGLETFNLERTVVMSTTTVTSPVGPINVPVGPYTVPAIPTLVTIKGFPNSTGGYCFAVNNSSTGDLPAGGICLPNLINNQQPFTVAVFPVASSELCGNNTCDKGVTETTVPEIAVGPMAIPDDAWKNYFSWFPVGGGERPAKPGSGIRVTVEWEADRDHLYIAASGPGGPNQNGVYQPFDFTSSSEINWFLSNKDRLAAKINIALLFPDGTLTPPADGQPDPFYFLPGGIKVPGLGQFIEASFSSRVAGR